MMRIAIFDNSWEGWPTLGEYARAQVYAALLAAHDDPDTGVCVVTSSDEPLTLPPAVSGACLETLKPPPFRLPGVCERVSRRLLSPLGIRPSARMREWTRWLRQNKLDVLVSFCAPDWWRPCPVAVCVWLPDFQHVRLPDYFTEKERRARDEEYLRMAQQADVVITSSETVKRDLADFSPDCAHKARVFRFPSLFAFRDRLEPPDTAGVLARYGIAPGFMLVVNQFFAHKNHEGLLEAMGRCQADGKCPQVVMIGSTIDHRDKATRTMSRVLSRVAELRLEGRAKILGFVPSEVRDDLLRACKVLIQPSEFEGWNTSIEDAKALGRPVLASDLPAHREQLADAFGFFQPADADALAKLLARADDELPPGPDPAREAECLTAARESARASGRALLAACREAMAFRDGRR